MGVKKKFDWYEVIAKALVKEPTELQHNRLITRASEWPTCACGQLCKALPRNKDKSPISDGLRFLGTSFYDNIHLRQWDVAKEIMDRIEEETIKQLKELSHGKSI